MVWLIDKENLWSTTPQKELDESRDEAAREAKRNRLFQAEVELLRSVEVRLKEEMAALRETNAQLEFEKSETAAKFSSFVQDHESYVQQVESKIQTLTVSLFRYSKWTSKLSSMVPMTFQEELVASEDEAARQEKRVRLFQAVVELLQSVESRFKEDMAALRGTIARIESEKSETAKRLSVALEEHESYVLQTESKINVCKVSPNKRQRWETMSCFS